MYGETSDFQCQHQKLSCECNKVVSDILGETEFLIDTESTGKMTHFEP